MIKLLRVPVVLGIAALWGLGSYWLGFRVLSDNVNVALTVAAAGAVVVVVGLGTLTRIMPLVLLGLPIAAAALGSAVYVAGVDAIDSHPRVTLTIASEKCVETTVRQSKQGGFYRECTLHDYTFADRSGTPVAYHLDLADRRTSGHSKGDVIDVYQRAPGEINFYPKPIVEPVAAVRKVAFIAVPLLAAYIVLLGLIGAVAGAVRRDRPEFTYGR